MVLSSCLFELNKLYGVKVNNVDSHRFHLVETISNSLLLIISPVNLRSREYARTTAGVSLRSYSSPSRLN